MIIRAAGRMACGHWWVATPTDNGDSWLFACEACGHRTELLPLTRDTSLGQVVAFPSSSVKANFSVGDVSGHQPRSPLIRSA